MKKDNANVLRSLAMVSQFGIHMIVPICMCCAAGYFLDEWLQTRFFVIIFFFVGALAGFRNIYIFARRIYEDDSGKDEEYDDRFHTKQQ